MDLALYFLIFTRQHGGAFLFEVEGDTETISYTVSQKRVTVPTDGGIPKEEPEDGNVVAFGKVV